MTLMCPYFKTETNVAQNLIDYFLTVRELFIERILSGKKYGGMVLIFENMEALHAELNRSSHQ